MSHQDWKLLQTKQELGQKEKRNPEKKRKKEKLQTDWWNIIKMRVPPQRAHPRSRRHYRHSKSCCLWNWQAAPGRVFDLTRNHYDALNWYRFVPYRCRSRWNIWSTLPEVNLSLGGASVDLSPLSPRRKQTSKTAESEAAAVDISTGWCFCMSPSYCCVKCACCMLLANISGVISVYLVPPGSHCLLFKVGSIWWNELAQIWNLPQTVNLLGQIFFRHYLWIM